MNLESFVEIKGEVGVVGTKLPIEQIKNLKNLVKIKSMEIRATCYYLESAACVKEAEELSKTRIECKGRLEYCPTLPSPKNQWLKF